MQRQQVMLSLKESSPEITFEGVGRWLAHASRQNLAPRNGKCAELPRDLSPYRVLYDEYVVTKEIRASARRMRALPDKPKQRGRKRW